MELVHGVPITRYCDANKLSPRERLELFVPVCQAIQHAHQKGIIHRDLKPSNVLVTLHDGQPVPKVIDFGVAKATNQRLTERTLFTQYGTIVGTLEYMAPEQAEMSGLGVDTRSDIYALGVLLYELLTGTTPLERSRLREAAYDEMLRLIREEEPARPSRRISTSGDRLATISAERNTEPAQLSRLVCGELDWIVMRCLEKDRTRRYDTASSLARDIQRYLADEPVEACPPSAGYRLRKFARKHKKLLVTTAAFAALLLLGVAGSAWQAVRATGAEVVAHEKEREAIQERNEAQRQHDEVKALNKKLEAALEQVRATEAHLRRTLYTAHMNLATRALDASDIGRVQALLEQHRPKGKETDLRNFEWYCLYRLSHSGLLTLPTSSRMEGRDRSVAFSPDGRHLAGVAGNHTVKIWDAQTGKELFTLKGHTASVSCVAFSPDGKRLVSSCWDRVKSVKKPGEVKVWDTHTGKELLRLQGLTTAIESVAFSPDGKRLASCGNHFLNEKEDTDGEVKLWDAETRKEIRAFKVPRNYVYSVAFSPDGKHLACAASQKAVVWDVETGKESLTVKEGRSYVAFSPDGKRLASGNKLWNAQTGAEIYAFLPPRSNGQVNSVAFSSDGKRLATCGGSPLGSDPTVKVWDVETGKELFSLKGHTGDMVRSVAFNPDGTRLASAGWDRTIKVWDVTMRQQAPDLSVPTDRIVCFAFSPDGKRLAFGAIPRQDPTKKVTGGQKLLISNAQTGKELATCKGHTGAVVSVAFSPDDKLLASASDDKTVKVWDAQTGQELLTCKGHTAKLLSVAFSPDGKRLVSSSERTGDGPGATAEIKIWDTDTGKELLSFTRALDSTKNLTVGTQSVIFSPDGKRLAGQVSDGEVKVWDAQTGKELVSLIGPKGTNCAVFSPDGKRLATFKGDAREESREIKIWDVQTGQQMVTLKGHSRAVSSVAFSPDGKRLASASYDTSVKVWDAQTGEELLTIILGTSPRYSSNDFGIVSFSPDGHRLATGAPGGTVTFWDGTPLPEKR
jgi:WD40 repeat protein